MGGPSLRVFGNEAKHPRTSMNVAISIAKWLLERRTITAATPVSVQIGSRTYSAARYTEKHNGVEEERLFIVGEMPPFHNRMRICYQTDGDEDTWHLVAWFRQGTSC